MSHPVLGPRLGACCLLPLLALTACGDDDAASDASSASTPRVIAATLPGWRTVVRLSPEQRMASGSLTLPEAASVHGVSEADPAALRLFLWLDTDPRPDSTEQRFEVVRLPTEGEVTRTEVPVTPFTDGQVFWFPGDEAWYSTMRSSELAQYNGGMQRWTAPETWLFAAQQNRDGIYTLQCGAADQTPEVTDLCDGVPHQMSVGVLWGRDPMDAVVLDDGTVAFAAQPYPTTSDRTLTLQTLHLGPTRGLEVGLNSDLLLSTGNDLFSPDSVTVTVANGVMYAITAGRTGVTQAPDGRSLTQYALAGARMDLATGQVTSLGQFPCGVATGPGVRDPLTGRIAYLTVDDGPNSVRDLTPEPGMIRLHQNGAIRVVYFDPARETFGALTDIPRLEVVLEADPDLVFSVGMPRQPQRSAPTPGDLLWDGGRLYLTLSALAFGPDPTRGYVSRLTELVLLSAE